MKHVNERNISNYYSSMTNLSKIVNKSKTCDKKEISCNEHQVFHRTRFKTELLQLVIGVCVVYLCIYTFTLVCHK